ncbi:serine/threonine-protein kinase [Nocardia sp. AG03]|uniref:serine/threonine-protein kinase n=1 Tax=Nocardia sp. AG03 TaxID=3025312 RepID=UPI002418A0AF|nr:serine/threonine-protein kinase [Nocardia sp. AG03]
MRDETGVFAGYTIERLLGRGGMGSVYLARHPRLPRRTAMKLLNRELFDDNEIRARFEREADLVAQLEHPNIVTVYDRGVENDQLWISMRYIEGSDAASLPVPVDPARAVRIVAETAAALDFAHSRGVLHRDVKPANILLEQAHGGERVYLTDFGIARLHDDTAAKLTQTGTFTATLAFASPEQLSGIALDGRADQYSLACTLFRLLTGTTPFEAANPVAVISGHLQLPPPSARALRPELPPALDAVIARAMAKRPAERFATCADFAAAADQALTGAQPFPTSAPTRTYPPNSPFTPAPGYPIPGTGAMPTPGAWPAAGAEYWPAGAVSGPGQSWPGAGHAPGDPWPGTGQASRDSSPGAGYVPGNAWPGAGHAPGDVRPGAIQAPQGSWHGEVRQGAMSGGVRAGQRLADAEATGADRRSVAESYLGPKRKSRWQATPGGWIAMIVLIVLVVAFLVKVLTMPGDDSASAASTNEIVDATTTSTTTVAQRTTTAAPSTADRAVIGANAAQLSDEFPRMLPHTTASTLVHAGSGLGSAGCFAYDPASASRDSDDADMGDWSVMWRCFGGGNKATYEFFLYPSADAASAAVAALPANDARPTTHTGRDYTNFVLHDSQPRSPRMVTRFDADPGRAAMLMYSRGFIADEAQMLAWWHAAPLV